MNFRTQDFQAEHCSEHDIASSADFPSSFSDFIIMAVIDGGDELQDKSLDKIKCVYKYCNDELSFQLSASLKYHL